MDRKTRICSCCGKSYQYCPRCADDKDKELWYFAFCSENCKNIYDVTSKYENNQVDATTAKKELDKLDLSGLKNFGESYKESIEKINSEAKENDKSKSIKLKKISVE